MINLDDVAIRRSRSLCSAAIFGHVPLRSGTAAPNPVCFVMSLDILLCS